MEASKVPVKQQVGIVGRYYSRVFRLALKRTGGYFRANWLGAISLAVVVGVLRFLLANAEAEREAAITGARWTFYGVLAILALAFLWHLISVPPSLTPPSVTGGQTPMRQLSDAGLAMRGTEVCSDAQGYIATRYRRADNPEVEAETMDTFRRDHLPRLLELFDALEERGFAEQKYRAGFEDVSDSRYAHNVASYLRQQVRALGGKQ